MVIKIHSDPLKRVLDSLELEVPKSLSKIANETGSHIDTVSKYIDILDDLGFVSKVYSGRFTFVMRKNIEATK